MLTCLFYPLSKPVSPIEVVQKYKNIANCKTYKRMLMLLCKNLLSGFLLIC